MASVELVEKKKTFKEKVGDWMEKHPRLAVAGIVMITTIMPLGIGYWCGNDHGKKHGELSSKNVHDYLFNHTIPGYLIHEDGVKLDLYHEDGAISHLGMSKDSDMSTWGIEG